MTYEKMEQAAEVAAKLKMRARHCDFAGEHATASKLRQGSAVIEELLEALQAMVEQRPIGVGPAGAN